MRIVHVSVGALPEVFGSWGGAIQRRVGALALEQASRGHDVVVYSPSLQERRAEIGGVDVRYISQTAPTPLAYVEFQFRAIANLLRSRLRPDVLHFHSDPEGALLSRPVRAACVLSYDNFTFRRGKRSPLFGAYGRILGRFDALLPVSEYCASASREYWDLPRERIHVLHNGVDMEQFRPDPGAASAERAAIGAKGRVILYVGRVCEQKGSDTLLEAYRRLRETRNDVNLVIAGPLGEFAAHNRTPDGERWRVGMESVGARYLGAVDDRRLRGLYNAAEVFVMPTKRLEMFGMAAVEAQACGVAVVASDHGGLRETVPDHCGVRFTPGDPHALCDAIDLLLRDDRRRRLASNCALANAGRFAWPRIGERLDQVYAAAIG